VSTFAPPGIIESTTTDPVILQQRLLDVEERVAQLQVIIPAGPNDNLKRELEQELRDLLRLRLDITQKLKPLAPSGEQLRRAEEAKRRHQQMVDIAVKERIQNLEWFIEKMTREGDHYSARQYRMKLLTVREDVERELGPP
jgi:hypothetical protein